MKRSSILSCVLLCAVFMTSIRCESPETEIVSDGDPVSAEVSAKLTALGFDVTNQAPVYFQDGYLVEGDIFLNDGMLARMTAAKAIPGLEQYHTYNLVDAPMNITVYLANSFSSQYTTALSEALSRYNAEGLDLTFSLASSEATADIYIERFPFILELFGYLGMGGFPAGGDPYDHIYLNGLLPTFYGMSTNGIATVIAHEIGHNIGFRHTDWFDRSISCGGSATDEGADPDGAELIPGTPSGASVSDGSFMLACTDGSDRPFNEDDQVALDYLY